MAARIAVVTDALSEGHFFPIWHRYYAGQFGAANLFVVGYAGGAEFRGVELGGVIRLPVAYDNETRARVMADFIASLLRVYDVVVRVDADEILAVDPRAAPSLGAFLQASDRPYLTARGFDVVQVMGERPMEPGPVLAQRRYAYPNSALNKTCVTRVPLTWSQGFHWASVHPAFGPLFMLHLKRVDVDWQLGWNGTLAGNMAGNPKVPEEIRAKYLVDQTRILEYHLGVSQRKRLSGIEAWYREEHQKRFLDSIAYSARTGFYVGTYDHDMALCELLPEWRGLI